MRNFRRTLQASVALAACLASPGSAAAPQERTQPKLIVLVVVDQMRADYLEHYKAQIAAGFRRLTSGGAVFTQAFYPYASTETAQGHALMLSGQSPSVSGIVGDTWWDRVGRVRITAGDSAEHRLIDSTVRGGSPEQMLVHTLGDAMKARDRRTIVLTASYKRYAAVLMGGQHADAAYWFDLASGHMVTSDYYRADYPDWVKSFNAADPTARFFGTEWLGHRLGTGAAPDREFRNALTPTPFANEMLLDFATRLLDHSELGQDDVPDLFCVSFSGLDYAGHTYGPETPEFDDTFKQVDRQIGALMDALDKRVGAGAWTLALVADHGAGFLPEKLKERGEDAGRIAPAAFRAAVVAELSKQFPNAAPLITAFEAPEFYLDYAEAARQGTDPAKLEDAVAAAARNQPAIAQVYTRRQIMAAGAASEPFLRAVAEGFYPSRSGDVYVVAKPNYIFWTGTGTTHGSPYEYDQHVPLIFYGFRIAQGKHDEHVLTNDLAPTLAVVAGVEMAKLPGKALRTALGEPARH